MSILTGKEIFESQCILGIQTEAINAASVDVHLGRTILIETTPPRGLHNRVLLSARDPLDFETFTFSEKNPIFWLLPNQFILANTIESFHMPWNLSGRYSSKSSMGRMGLEHMNSGWIDAGFNGSTLTLEFKNMSEYHTIGLKMGDAVGQIVVYSHNATPEEFAYDVKGSYNGIMETSPARFAKPS